MTQLASLQLEIISGCIGSIECQAALSFSIPSAKPRIISQLVQSMCRLALHASPFGNVLLILQSTMQDVPRAPPSNSQAQSTPMPSPEEAPQGLKEVSPGKVCQL